MNTPYTACAFLAEHLLFVTGYSIAEETKAVWKEPAHRVTMTNETIHAETQSGQLVLLEDRRTGQRLINIDLSEMDSNIPVYGNSRINLDEVIIHQKWTAENSIATFLQDGEDRGATYNMEPRTGTR